MSGLLNGPITLCVVGLGTIFNVLTIYILSVKTLQRHRMSIYNSPLSQKKLSSSNKDVCGNDGMTASIRRRTGRSQSGIITSNRPRVYTFFVWLAISDTLLLVSALLMYCLPTLLHGKLGFYVHFFPYFYLMSNTALTASVWLMCALMFDRYRTLCKPFAMRSNNVSLIHRLLFSVCLISLAFSLPRFFELHVRHDSASNTHYVAQTDLVHNQLYMVGYRIVGGLLFYSLLPYVVLFCFSFKVWLVIRTAAMARLKMTASGSVLHACATDSEMILIAVISKFLLSRLIPTMLDVVEHLVGPVHFTRSATLTICVDISNLIVVTSSGINLFIFYVFSSSFRRAVTSLLSGGNRPVINSPLSNLSTLTMTTGKHSRGVSSSHIPRKLPRQMSLQVEICRRPTLLQRKQTVGSMSVRNGRKATVGDSVPVTTALIKSVQTDEDSQPSNVSTTEPSDIIAADPSSLP